MHSERLLERFLRYVAIDTTANPHTSDYPSSPGQLVLGRMLVDELRDLGLADARQDDHGIVIATLPGNRPGPVICLCSHLDTSPETTGANVRPQVIRDYDGGDIALPGNPAEVIRAAGNPELAAVRGGTVITTDGTTLLGGDDKAGVAVIMELVAHLVENPGVSRGDVRILFTCDEEIGRGVDHVDVPGLGADVGYTLDGTGAGVIDVETFSGDLATVTFHGVNLHPSIAKGKMVNAVRAAGAFAVMLPREAKSPESTAEREGFLHPYEIQGGVAEATVRVLLRDFETARLAEYADQLRGWAAKVERELPGMRAEVEITEQYRNLGDGVREDPRCVAWVEAAARRLGRPLRHEIVRGGTDGSLLTEKGLPTPNLACGQHTQHSPQEWACLDEMVGAAELLVEILQVAAEESGGKT